MSAVVPDYTGREKETPHIKKKQTKRERERAHTQLKR
jgi:hypothetical protein